MAIEALLLITLQEQPKYKDLVKRRGQEAQHLLNLLQAVSLIPPKCMHQFYKW
jgi:hypothetical protein